jgi:hypothetical protein
MLMDPLLWEGHPAAEKPMPWSEPIPPPGRGAAGKDLTV